MTTTYRSRSPIRDSNTTRPSYPSGGDGRRENWRMRLAIIITKRENEIKLNFNIVGVVNLVLINF